MLTTTQQQFVNWLRVNEPIVFQSAKNAANNAVGLSAADTAEGNWWDSFVGAAKQLVPVIVQAKSQKKILDVQLRRAQQGLPPLDAGQIAPTVRVQAGLTPSMKKILIPSLAIGAGLLFYFMMGRKKRK